MPKLLKNGVLTDDRWQMVDHEHLQQGVDLVETERWLIPLAQWDEISARLQPGQNHVGVWVTGDEPVERFVGKADKLPLIAIKFPVFTDGRGFSLARQLRERLSYQGELRATGYFLLEQMHYLHRCGFDAFELDDDADVEVAQRCLKDFSNWYQAAVVEPRPLFRRRA